MDIDVILVEIVKRMVDYPDDVKVTVTLSEDMTIYVLFVAESDRGKVIGKKGKTADALRTLMVAWTGKARKQYILEIVQ